MSIAVGNDNRQYAIGNGKPSRPQMHTCSYLVRLLASLGSCTMVGFRQRLGRAAASDRSRSPPKVGQHSLTKWLNGWAWGNVPASELVREAHAYVHDHGQQKVDSSIMRLARAHSSIQNAERVVEGILPLEGMPEPIRLADSIIDTILLPFDLFRWLKVANPT